MDFLGIYDHLKAKGAPGVLDYDLPREPDPADKKDKGRGGDAFILVEAAQLCELLLFCRDDEALRFEQLIDLTATDPSAKDESFWIGAQLLSVTHKHRLALKAILPKEKPVLPSCVPAYRAAQWLERECMEMFGVVFEGNPDPRNILLPDDWVGYPLRKDYEYPKEYHGISCEE